MTNHEHVTGSINREPAEPDGSRSAQGVVAVAWPTGRPIYPYTVDELAEGVDLYTRAVKAAARRNHLGGSHET